MFIDNTTKKRVNIYAHYKGFSKLDTPEIRARVNVVEIPEPSAPEDFSDELYYKTEQVDAPYVVYTPKSLESVNASKKEKLKVEIKQKEQEAILNRAVREFMLLLAESQAAAQGVTPAQLYLVNPAYRAIKDFDTEVSALRTELKAIP
jgi:hypothetical protein